ncbi:MAG: transporter substrate-binding protein [Eubacterium sp.]|nr:transporter substrate-binding protein [Eubacterium sp.]
MKKLVVMLLCLLMLISIAGCGAGTSPADSTSAGESNTASAGGKLVVWAWDQNLPSINYAVDMYKKAHADSKIEVVVQNVPDTVDKMSTFFASGVGKDLPDMVLMDNIQIQTFLQQFPDKFVNLSKMGFDEYKDNFSKAHLELLSHEGALYAFPFDVAPMMLEVNTEIMKKANVDPASLATWDDFANAAAAVNKAGYAMHIKFAENEVLGMMQSAGVGIFDSERNIDLLNPKVVEVVEKYMKLQSTNASDKVIEDGAKFGEEKVATMLKPAWSIGEDMPVQKSLSGKVTLIPMPKMKNEAGYTSSANNGGSSFFILESSKVKDAAYEIGKYITTELESQKIALSKGLMPGYLPSAELPEFTAGVEYFSGQPIWKLLSESSAQTLPIYVNEFYSSAKETFKNTLIDAVKAGTDKSAKDLLKETADAIAAQSGLKVKEY